MPTGDEAPRSVAPIGRRPPPGMPVAWRIAVNLIGPVAFIAIYLHTGQLVDGAWAMLAGTIVSVAAGWFAEHRIAPLPMVLAILSGVFAAATLIFHSAAMLKLEITVRSSAIGFAVILALLLGFNPLRALFGRVLVMGDDAYRRLGWRFAIFSLAVALINWAILRGASNAVWVAFKFPGVLILHLVFLATQWPLISAGRRDASASAPPPS